MLKNCLINQLVRHHSYIIEEFTDEYGNPIYALKKEKENCIDFIIFLDDENSENVFLDKIKFKYYGQKLNIFKVIFKHQYESNQKYSWKDTLIYDMSKNRVIYFDESTKKIAIEIGDAIQRSGLIKPKQKKAIVTYVLIGINIVYFIISVFLSRSLLDINLGVLIFLGAKVNTLIANGQYYRLISCMFLHGGLLHIALNMYALYIIGPIVETAYGKLKYLIIYFVSGIASSLLSFVFSDSVSIGASGAIFGLLGAVLILSIKMKEKGNELKKNIISVIAINVFLGFTISNIDNFGHLGGLIGGSIASLVIIACNSRKITE